MHKYFKMNDVIKCPCEARYNYSTLTVARIKTVAFQHWLVHVNYTRLAAFIKYMHPSMLYWIHVRYRILLEINFLRLPRTSVRTSSTKVSEFSEKWNFNVREKNGLLSRYFIPLLVSGAKWAIGHSHCLVMHPVVVYSFT
jgi:hypothetical protein